MTRTLRHQLLRLVLALVGLAALTGWRDTRVQAQSPESGMSVATNSISSLASAMDQFHTRFPVYDDVSSAGNHFHAPAKFPDGSALVSVSGSYGFDKHSGATSMRATFVPGGANFGGYVLQNGVLPSGAVVPALNFGTEPSAGYDLSGATSLTFWAKGGQGGEIIDFFMGGVGWSGNAVTSPCTATISGPCPFPDSTPAVKITVTLTTQWTQYSIDLTGTNLSYVLGGFGFGVNGALNPNPSGTAFLVDDIQYNLTPTRQAARLDEPRFIPSFKTLPLQPDLHDGNPDDDIDLVMRGAAFVYDNSLALLAFLADGTDDSVRRARLIGDAFVYATAHDRSFTDGRLRSAFSAGDIALPPGWRPNNRTGTVPVAGFYEDLPTQFSELSETRVFDTGNQAWAMVSLLALHGRTGDVRYLNAARLLGNVIHGFRGATGAYQGFLGGLEFATDDASSPIVRSYASAEHNLDVYAAFSRMFDVTGEAIWQSDALHARQFVDAMWDTAQGCYLPGTVNPNLRNTAFSQLPLDVQAWSVLALPDGLLVHPQVLACAEANHHVVSDGFTGFDFNTDREGVWFEGTAHMATAFAWAHQLPSANFYRQELNRAQLTAPFGDGSGIAAASHDATTTGFGFKLFRRLHVGATAWHVFALRGFNPYYQTVPASDVSVRVTPSSLRFGGSKNGDQGALLNVTPPQQVTVTFEGAASSWVATSPAPWLQITGGQQSGAGQFSVAVVNPGNVIGGNTLMTTTITISAPAAPNSPLVLPVTLSIDQTASMTAAAFGQIDTPVQGATNQVGAIGVTGWALDDLSVMSVKIYRACLSFDNPASCQTILGHNVVFVGDAAFLAGARPDVENAFPTFPFNYRGGWGMQILTNMMPDIPATQPFGGQGVIELFAVATDVEGHRTLLGRSSAETTPTPTTISMNNNAIAKPFGTADTPLLGATVTGLVPAFVWALTPDSNTTAGNGDIQLDPSGSTIVLFIDGVSKGPVAFNQCRGSVGNPPVGFCNDDVASIFGNLTPQAPLTTRTSNPTPFRNLDVNRGAIGVSLIDTTLLTNGLHDIAWSVTDSAGRVEGIGSRFFIVLNGSSLAERIVMLMQAVTAPAMSRGSAASLSRLPISHRLMSIRQGFDTKTPTTEFPANREGVRRTTMAPYDRLEITLPGAAAAGYLEVKGELRDLPIGSHLDVTTGVFTWVPPTTYFGAYRLVFVIAGERVIIEVRIENR